MDNKKAVKLAVECIRKEIQRLAVDANLQEIYQTNSPHTIAASKKRALLREAITTLQGQPETPITPKKKPGIAMTQPALFDEKV